MTVQPVQGGSKALPFLLNGSLDVAFGNYVSFLPAQAHGAARLRILAEGCVAGPSLEVVLAMPGSGIKTVAAGWRSAGLARVPGLG